MEGIPWFSSAFMFSHTLLHNSRLGGILFSQELSAAYFSAFASCLAWRLYNLIVFPSDCSVFLYIIYFFGTHFNVNVL